MTLLELYNSVAQLGFEDSLDDGGTIRFLQATNRAILQVNEIRPRKKLFTLNHIDTSTLTATRVDWCDVDGEMIFTADLAKGIYFEVCGQGNVEINLHKRFRTSETNEDGETVEIWHDNYPQIGETIQFSTNGFVPFKRLVCLGDKYITDLMQGNTEDSYYSGAVLIRFYGDVAFTVRNLAMYHTLVSRDEERIPESGASVQYDMNLLVSDFLRFGMPLSIVKNGVFVTESNYSVIGGNRLVLPQSGFGAYNVEYVCKPQQFAQNVNIDDYATIALDDDLCAVLPLLIASYIWLDDEPEKAQYYYNLYLQRSTEIASATRGNSTLPFVSVNGWW